MIKRWSIVVCVIVPNMAWAAALPLSTNVTYLPVPHGAAVILNSGSTNTAGYRIVVQSNGMTEFVSRADRARRQIPELLARKLFADLRAAAPLESLPSAGCMKSISFGVAMFVYWNHSRSPDVTCPAGPRASAIYADALNIAAALNLGRTPGQPVMRPLMPHEPRQPLPASPASTLQPSPASAPTGQ